MTNLEHHQPVLLKQAISAMNIKPGGIYVDGTFGRGGHSQAILDQLARLGNDGKLFVIDQDPEAIAIAHDFAAKDSRIIVCQGNFKNLKDYLKLNNVSTIDGILLDLGVSSPQLDKAERGFSFSKDGPLDMRMDHTKQETAAQWLKSASVDEIAHVLWFYGEERYSRKIARGICQARTLKPITRTLELAEIIKESHPNWPKNKHPATKSFMAIRLYINQELESLQDVLRQSVEVLSSNGKLVVITFHSLEDRIVKNFIKNLSRTNLQDNILNKLPLTDKELSQSVCGQQPQLKDVQKALKAGIIEKDINIRARSAILRVATKI